MREFASLKLNRPNHPSDSPNFRYFLVMRRTPVKIKSPPSKISGVMVSPMKTVANKTVTNGSAKRKELATAAFILLITWNQIKYPKNEHVTARYRIPPHP